MMKLSKSEKVFFIIGGVIIVGLVIMILVITGLNNQSKKSKNQYLSLDKSNKTEKMLVENGKFSDAICGISFDVPSGMIKSSTLLSLPQEPLSQTVFDDGINKSVLSYICYDGKYTFDEFSENGNLKTEMLNAGDKSFSRVGNFVYFNKGNKLIIFQMFFTKNDLNPKSGYEDKLQKLLESIS